MNRERLSNRDSSPLATALDAAPGEKGLPDFSAVNGECWRGARFTVLAVGNPIMGDDGIGLEIFARLRSLLPSRPNWVFAAQSGDLAFVEGGTGGMELVPVVQESENLLILDSIAPGTKHSPGEAVRFSGDHVPRLLSMKMSPHQVGLLDVLTSARLTRREPKVLEVVGVVGSDVDVRLGLSPKVEQCVDQAVELAAAVLDSWLS